VKSNKTDDGRMRILLVEDSRVVSGVVAIMLKKLLNGQADVVAAYSGEEAIDAMRDIQELDLLITDFGLRTSTDGIEVIRFMLDATNLRPKVLAMSGTIEDFKEALNERLEDKAQLIQLQFIQKPLEREALQSFLSELMAK